MSYRDDLVSARDLASAKLVALLTDSENYPNESVEGRSQSWSDYRKGLEETIVSMNKYINMFDGYDITSRVC